jgi:hypothetical protein
MRVKKKRLTTREGFTMSGQHARFEEESRGEPSYQLGYATHDELPPLSYDHADMPGQKLQADSPGAAQSTTPNLHFVLALLSLIFVFVLVALVVTLDATLKSVGFIELFFVVLFAVLAIFLNLIFTYGRNASSQSTSKPEE